MNVGHSCHGESEAMDIYCFMIVLVTTVHSSTYVFVAENGIGAMNFSDRAVVLLFVRTYMCSNGHNIFVHGC